MASVTRSSLCRRAGLCQLAVLLLALAAAPRLVAAAVAAVEHGGEPRWHVVTVSSLLPSTVCTGTAASTVTSSSNTATPALSVVHRHGPCSPLHSRGGGPPPPSHTGILSRDRRRVESIRRRITSSASAATSGGVSLPVRWGTTLGDNDYIITVGLGTPAREFSVELDTGSDLSWVQCTPCRGCYKQRDPLFDPARSSTFSAVHCGAPACQGFAAQNCSSTDGKCGYVFHYADGSVTKGNLVRDTLTLSPSETLPGFVFGCGHADTGTFGEFDGLFGLARGRVSLASQAAGTYGARFSYCLPSTSSAVGYLSLGGGTTPPPNTQFTAMVNRSDTGMPSLYYVNLVSIMVAGVALEIPPAEFMRTSTIVDSGTVITFLPPRAYAALRSAFTRSMRKYKRAPPLDDSIDTCYDFTGIVRVTIPAVALVFADGATVSLDAGGVMYTLETVAQACLAFAANDDETYVGILGNTQQKTFTVVYDVGNHKIGFAAKGCS